jgi:hypothetical protein
MSRLKEEPMRSLQVQAAIRKCFDAAWGELACEVEKEVTPESASTVFLKLFECLKEVFQTGFKAWLEASDVCDKTINRNGELLRFKFVSPKTFWTLIGPVNVERRLYQGDRGGPTYAPLDEAWNMTDQFATPEVREAASFLMALMPADEAHQAWQKTGCAPSETTMKKLSGEFGKWLESHPEVIDDVRAEESIPPETRSVCAGLDGSNLRVSEPGGRLGRRPVGANGEPEKTCFKNAMVGSVSLYGEVPPKEEDPERLQTKYISHTPEDNFPTFRSKFEAELSATLAKCGPDVIKVLTIDAATTLKNYIASSSLLSEFEQIVDFWHSQDHLAMAAEALFGKGTDEAQQWKRRQCNTLLNHQDGARRVIRAMGHAKGRHRMTKWCRKEVEKQQQFFRNNGNRMKYAEFRARGLPIGSGVVEAAGKMIIKSRMCRSGMRWTRPGAQHILAARTIIKSNRWTAAWKRYLPPNPT